MQVDVSLKARSAIGCVGLHIEHEQRSDLGQWETALRSQDSVYRSILKEPTFDAYYNARKGGANSGKDPELHGRLRTAWLGTTVCSCAIRNYASVQALPHTVPIAGRWYTGANPPPEVLKLVVWP